MLPLWARASTRLRRELRLRQAPLLALGAAFSFIIMLFNIPIPGGASGHAVGAVLIAILLGPWAALIAVSLALVIQALLFGDGGITTFAANCMNIALIMPFVGWGVYRLLAGGALPGSKRQIIAGAVAGYVGLNAAALATAVMLGIQPLIAHDAAGRALFNPFGLHITVPVMMLEHLLVFGFLEAVVTGLALGYLSRTDPSLVVSRRVSPGWSVAAFGVLLVLGTAGWWLSAHLPAGSAWGEWDASELPAQMAKYGLPAYLPHELARWQAWWKAPLPDYALPVGGKTELAYLLAVILGASLVGGVLLRRFYTRRGPDDHAAGVDVSARGA